MFLLFILFIRLLLLLLLFIRLLFHLHTVLLLLHILILDLALMLTYKWIWYVLFLFIFLFFHSLISLFLQFLFFLLPLFLFYMHYPPGNVRKLPETWGYAVVFTGYSGFLHQLQLASHDAVWQKKWKKNDIPKGKSLHTLLLLLHTLILDLVVMLTRKWISSLDNITCKMRVKDASFFTIWVASMVEWSNTLLTGCPCLCSIPRLQVPLNKRVASDFEMPGMISQM